MSAEPVLPSNLSADDVSPHRPLPDLPAWLRELYPFAPRTVDVGVYRMSYVEEGAPDAPPLLMLHGNPGWSFTFRKLVPEVKARYRAIAPDLIGFGLSDKPADPGYHTLPRHIENLGVFIDRLGLRHLTLLLHDWGGPIGLGYAVAHPENVARIVLTNTWAFPMPNPATVKLPLGVRLANRGALGELLDSLLSLSVSSALAPVARTAADLVVEAYKHPAHTPAGRIASRVFWQMLRPGAVDAELERIHAGLAQLSAPVDIIWGASDRILSRLPAYLLRDSFKNVREPQFVEGASHYVAEDTPEALVAKLMEKRQPATRLKIIG